MTAPALVRRDGVDALVPAEVLAVAASLAAAGLAISSNGSTVVAAVLVGLGLRHRWAGLAVLAAVVAAAVRFGATDLGGLAGIQSVLGPAGSVGPPVAAASAWLAGAAVLLAASAASAARTIPGNDGRPVSRAWLVPPALASGALAAALVAGPGPGGGLGLRIAATAGAVALAAILALLGVRNRRVRTVGPGLAVLAGLVSIATAAWPT